jgi:phosphatidate cytidylyltransferase
MAAGDLGRRVAVAALGIPLGVVVILLGGWTLAVVVGILAAIGTHEVYALAAARGWRPFPWVGVPAALLLVGFAVVAGGLAGWAPVALSVLLLVALVSMAAAVFRRGAEGDPLLAAGTTLIGVTYAGAPMAFAVLLREYPGGGATLTGAFLVMFPLVVTWMGDTAAYFTGRRFGRRKLLPAVSPKKTVEGGVGGLLGAVGGAILFAILFLGPADGLIARDPGAPTMGWMAAAGLGLLIGAVAQVGDLAESVLKREAGVKDSGSILPGHGGVLDRFDAVYFTLPLTYALLPVALS